MNQAGFNKSFWGRGLLVFLLWLLLYTSAFGQTPPKKPLPFQRGEELVYQVEFTRGLLHSVLVGEINFTAEAEHVSRGDGAEDPIVMRLTGDVVSKGLFPRIAGFKLHQHVVSTASVEPFTVLHTDKVEEQGKRQRVLEADYDHEKHKVIWRERSPTPQGNAFDFSEPIQDVLTVIYFLRTQKLEVGKSFEVPLTDAGRVYRLSVTAVERKDIDTVLGRVSAVRVEPALSGASALANARGKLSIWITDDDRELPVKAQLKVDMGTFDIKLKRVSYPEPK